MVYKVGRYPKIDAVIASIDFGGEPWEKAKTAEAGHMYQIRAAQNMDIYEPFSDEQTALNAYLTQIQASLRHCDYAWRLFVQSM